MRRKAGLWIAVVLVLVASVLFTAEYKVISGQIKDSKQMLMQGDFLKEKLTPEQEQELTAAQEEANRQKAMAALRESRAQTEAARKRSGDPTPIVEAIVATADNRFCALIGDALVSEGDVVQGYQVRKIFTDTVEFEKDGKTWTQKVD
jgi:hypothetical protein